MRIPLFEKRVLDFNRRRREEDAESLCRKCGECCRLLVGFKEQVISLDIWCPAIDMETKRCRIYDRRHELLPEFTGRQCGTAVEAREAGVLPSFCAYAEDGYRNVNFDAAKVAELPTSAYKRIVDETKAERKKIDRFLQNEPSST